MDFASQNLTAGQLNAIVKKLGGEDGAMRFLRGEIVVAVPTPPAFSIWKTVKLGTGKKNADDYRSAISQARMKIGNWGNDILGKPAFTVSETEVDLDLVVVRVLDLGFKDGAYSQVIITKALDLGLQLCPAEVGPALRLEYRDQPKGEWLVIGMEPITGSDGHPYVFHVAHDHDERWLHGSHGYPVNFWHADYRFVFVRPKE
ncbi:hypothetical protein KW790_01800 [Candidatus Parcubacteria bacterium]|nr:hypothetical protein [Candidatus Parcubacteria bacterium]